jgi:hypothetical protein
MSNKANIPDETVQHYSELKWKLRKGNALGYKENSDDFEQVSTYYTYYNIPKGLSDEDKLICMLLLLHNMDRGLTKRELTEAFGWNKYKSGKLAKQNPFCKTVTLICEGGGYGGRGYALIWDMHHAILDYRVKNYPCCKCAKFTSGYCSIDTQIKRYPKDGCVNGKFELSTHTINS